MFCQNSIKGKLAKCAIKLLLLDEFCFVYTYNFALRNQIFLKICWVTIKNSESIWNLRYPFILKIILFEKQILIDNICTLGIMFKYLIATLLLSSVTFASICLRDFQNYFLMQTYLLKERTKSILNSSNFIFFKIW